MRFRLRQRLRRTVEFDAVRTHGKKFFGRFFILQLLEHSPLSPRSQRTLGVVASRRVGNAVQRNRAKRLLREVFRRHPKNLPDDCAIVLTARQGIVKASFDQVRRDYNQMTKKAWSPFLGKIVHEPQVDKQDNNRAI